MVHPARRLWRGARPLVNLPGAQRESCTLSALERADPQTAARIVKTARVTARLYALQIEEILA